MQASDLMRACNWRLSIVCGSHANRAYRRLCEEFISLHALPVAWLGEAGLKKLHSLSEPFLGGKAPVFPALATTSLHTLHPTPPLPHSTPLY